MGAGPVEGVDVDNMLPLLLLKGPVDGDAAVSGVGVALEPVEVRGELISARGPLGGLNVAGVVGGLQLCWEILLALSGREIVEAGGGAEVVSGSLDSNGVRTGAKPGWIASGRAGGC